MLAMLAGVDYGQTPSDRGIPIYSCGQNATPALGRLVAICRQVQRRNGLSDGKLERDLAVFRLPADDAIDQRLERSIRKFKVDAPHGTPAITVREKLRSERPGFGDRYVIQRSPTGSEEGV